MRVLGAACLRAAQGDENQHISKRMGHMEWIMTSPFHLSCPDLKALDEKEQALLWVGMAPDGGTAAPWVARGAA